MEKSRRRKVKKNVKIGLLFTFLVIVTTLCFVSIGLGIVG